MTCELCELKDRINNQGKIIDSMFKAILNLEKIVEELKKEKELRKSG